MRDLRASRALSEQLVAHTDRLCDIAKTMPEFASEIAAAIEQIRDAAQELGRTLATFDPILPQPDRNTTPRELSATKVHPPVPSLTRQEMVSLTPEASRERENGNSTQRYQFTSTLPVAPWAVGDMFPADEEFQSVKCRDISAGGISFLWPDQPDFEHVVIAALCGDSTVYMVGQLVYSRAVYMFDEVGYLVGCKFTKRISAPAGVASLPYVDSR